MASWIFALRGTREQTTAKTQNRKRNIEERQPLTLSNWMMHKAKICREAHRETERLNFRFCMWRSCSTKRKQVYPRARKQRARIQIGDSMCVNSLERTHWQQGQETGFSSMNQLLGFRQGLFTYQWAIFYCCYQFYLSDKTVFFLW